MRLGHSPCNGLFAIDSRLATGPAVQELFGEYFQIYRALFMAFYVTMGYGLTSAGLNFLLDSRAKPISMPWRIGLNLAVFSLSIGLGITVFAVTFIEGNRGMPIIYQLVFILNPISLAIVAATSFAGQKVRERFAPKA